MPLTEFNSLVILFTKIFFRSAGVLIALLVLASFLRKFIISSVKSKPVSPEINFSSRESQKSASNFELENNFAIPPLHFSFTLLKPSRNFANNDMIIYLPCILRMKINS